MTVSVQVARLLVLPAARPVDDLRAWLLAVRARASTVAVGDGSFLVVTPLGWTRRERLLERLEAHGVSAHRRVAIPAWPRVDSAIRITRLDPLALRRAARFEAVWESLYPATPAEAWVLTPAGRARAASLKRTLRGELPALRVDLGDGSPAPATLHPFHLADPWEAQAEARRLVAALALLAERRRGPLRRLEDLLAAR